MITTTTTLSARMFAATFLVTAGFATGAFAQSNPSAAQLINELKPTGMLSDTTRGIKPLGPDDSAPAPAMQAAPLQAAPMQAAPMQATPVAMSTTMSYAAPPPAPVPDMAAPSANLSVDFPSGSADLTPNAMATLDVLGKALTSAQLASYNFKIAGHTDTVGDPAANQTLSEQRAAAVKSYLEAKFGIADSRLQAVGMGESDPAVPTPPNTPNRANRRVQIINLGS